MEETSPKNAYISKPEEIAEGVFVRMVLEDHVPRLQIVLVIDEYTNFDSINRSRKDIKSLLRSINQQQGNDLNEKNIPFIYGLLQWHQEGIGWIRSVMLLNYLCNLMIYSAYIESTNKGEYPGNINDSQGLISNPSFLNTYGSMFLSIFLAFGRTIEEFNEWMIEDFEELDKGSWGIDRFDRPFTVEQLRIRIRYLKQRIKDGRITISSSDSNWNSLEYYIYILNRKGFIEKFDDLLNKMDLPVWRRNRKYIHSKLVSICNKWDNTTDPKMIKFRDSL